jgi:hypothetical protein
MSDRYILKGNRLKIQGDFWDTAISFLSSIYFIIASFLSVAGGIIIQYRLKIEGELTGFLVYVLSPALILFGIYTFYRVWNNRKLVEIHTGFRNPKNRQLLYQFFEDRKYEILIDNDDSILINDENELSYNNLWTKHIWFLIKDDTISFNIQNYYPTVNPPVYISNILLKQDMKSFIKKTATSEMKS